MPRRILIVEDDRDLTSAEQTILEGEGYEVLHAPDGMSALEILAREAVDLVLLDVNMPRMDGHELVRRLRQNPETARLNVLMVTAMGSVEETIKGLEAGADDYLSKPFEVPELLARVRAQLRLRALQERLVAMEKKATIAQMVITLSHEINNPLTSVLWHAQLMQEWLEEAPAVGENVWNSLRALVQEANRIQKVIDRLQSLEEPAVKEYVSGVEMIDLGSDEL
jgi:DNA-binding response OmpR family regulator